MTREQTLSILRSHEHELRAMGLTSLSLFGSVARGDAGPSSDVDLAGTFDASMRLGIFGHIGLVEELKKLLGTEVDLVREPVHVPYMKAAIDRDRYSVF
jgi:uncharacterized protein